MIKILHTSDIHIGAKLSYLKDKSNVQRDQIRQTFEKVVDVAIEKKVDLVAISGDLFDNPFPSKISINFVKSQLEKLAKALIKVAIIAGNHDRLEPGSVFLSDEFCGDSSNIHIFTPENGSIWIVEDLDLTVYGVSAVLQKSRKSPLSEIKINEKAKTKNSVALIHGSVNMAGREADNYPIDVKLLESLPVEYVALGDWHSRLEVVKDKVWYSGSPELIDSDQKGSGNVLLIEIDSGTRVIPLRVGKREVIVQEVDLGKYENLSSLQKDILLDAHENLIKLVSIKGKKSLSFDLDKEELEDTMRGKFFYLKIADESHLELTQEELDKYPQELLIGRYIKLLRENEVEDKEIIDEAIQYGVKKLSGTQKN
ncbi:DNA repair exonuclease [Candidatus Dojkabacteria bacterium]|nr:DNA repair exonuclease [Candidatus Dojkabacteria bacterium]